MRVALLGVAALLLLGAGGAEFVPLREARNPALQQALEATIARLDLEVPVRERRLAVALAGITDPACPRLAAVNGNVMMYAASLPKIAILLAALRRVQDGELELDSALEGQLHAMIRRSSNRAASRVMQRVGRDYINRLLQSEEYALYDPDFNGGLWVGKPYGPEPAFRRDPLHQLSHGASAIQAARFFYLLESERLLNAELTAKAKDVLARPGIRHKFVAGLLDRHPHTRLYRKSGTWRDYHSDAAMIERDGKRYVAVAMAHHPNGERWLRRLILGLDEAIFTVPPRCEPDGVALPEEPLL